MPKLTIEYADITGENNREGYFLRVFVDGEPIGMVRRLEMRQREGDPFPTLEIDQIIYSREALSRVEKLQRVPGLKYSPIFMNHQGDFVPEKDAWFLEDHPEMAENKLTGPWAEFMQSEDAADTKGDG